MHLIDLIWESWGRGMGIYAKDPGEGTRGRKEMEGSMKQ